MSFKKLKAKWAAARAERMGEKTTPAAAEEEIVAPVVQEVVQFVEVDFDEMTRDELYDVADEMDIDGRSSMNKAELLEAVKAATE